MDQLLIGCVTKAAVSAGSWALFLAFKISIFSGVISSGGSFKYKWEKAWLEGILKKKNAG